MTGGLERHDDGTATMTFDEVPVDIDEHGLPVDPAGDVWTPAWRVNRPTMGVLRHLNETWWRLGHERDRILAGLNERATAIRKAIEDGADVPSEDTELVKTVSERMVTTLEVVVEGWWAEVERYLCAPLTEFPRPVVPADYPPWLSRSFGIYNALTTHWMAVPLDRGRASLSGGLLTPRTTSPPSPTPAPPAPVG